LEVAVLEAQAQTALQEQHQVGIHRHLVAAQQFLLLVVALGILALQAEQVVLAAEMLDRVQQAKEIQAGLVTMELKAEAEAALEQ
jgi:hypothetical protein